MVRSMELGADVQKLTDHLMQSERIDPAHRDLVVRMVLARNYIEEEMGLPCAISVVREDGNVLYTFHVTQEACSKPTGV